MDNEKPQPGVPAINWDRLVTVVVFIALMLAVRYWIAPVIANAIHWPHAR